MQFSDTSTSTGIVQDITFLLGGGVDTNAYTLADRARNVTQRAAVVWSWIFSSYGGAIFDDANQTDLPQSTTTLTANTSKYALPSDAITIKGIEVKDQNAIWTNLVPITLEYIRQHGAEQEFLKTSGQPRYYRWVGETYQLYPAPNYTQSASLKVYYDRGMSSFASGDTTKTPGFASPFHRVLSIGAALDFAISRGMSEKIEMLSGMWNDYEKRIKEFYETRFQERTPQNLATTRDEVGEYT